MENLDKVHSGKLYFPDDEGTLATQRRAQELMYDFNATRPGEVEKRLSLLHMMLAECGQGCWIEPPMKANWGGANLHLGEHVYINAGLTLVDDTHIYIGDYTMLGPNVMIATAGHPILPSLRREECMQIQPACAHRLHMLDRGIRLHPSRRQHRRWQRHRGGSRRDEGHPLRRRRRRQPLPSHQTDL